MHWEQAPAFSDERERAKNTDKHQTYREHALGICHLHELTVTEARENGLLAGRYLTLHFPSVFSLSPDEELAICEALAAILEKESERLLEGQKLPLARVLFVGLGNPYATADALGPLAARRIRPTAQLSSNLREKLEVASLAIFTPLLPALTGIESASLVRAVVKAVSPSLVLIADAMTTASTSRLGQTAQLTDTGICPGSGVGEGGVRLDRAFLGVPVLSVGFPTVLDAATYLKGNEERKEGFPSPLAYLLPHEADAACERLAAILAQAVERVFGLPHL